VRDHVEQRAQDARAGELEGVPEVVLALESVITGSVRTIERSWRSPAITTSTIPFSTTGN
jgi:hypothetical protein